MKMSIAGLCLCDDHIISGCGIRPKTITESSCRRDIFLGAMAAAARNDMDKIREMESMGLFVKEGNIVTNLHGHIDMPMSQVLSCCLARACNRDESLDVAKHLMETGGDISFRDHLPVKSAVLGDAHSVLRYLMSKDPTVPEKALEFAIHLGKVDVIRTIIDTSKPGKSKKRRYAKMLEDTFGNSLEPSEKDSILTDVRLKYKSLSKIIS